MANFKWDDFRLFLALIRTGNVRGAAHNLGISHSTVARRIDTMTHRMGARLFERTQNGYALTPAGEEVMAAAEEIEAQIHHVERRVLGQERQLSGVVSLSMSETLTTPRVMAALAGFSDQYPQICVQLDVSNNPVSLDKGETNIALRFVQHPPDHLIGTRLSQVARAVYGRADLIDQDNNERPRQISYLSDIARASPQNTAQVNLSTDNIPAQLRACEAGFGTALLPCFLGDASAKLSRLSEPELRAQNDLWLLKHRDLRSNVRIRALYAYLAKAFKQLAPSFVGAKRAGG